MCWTRIVTLIAGFTLVASGLAQAQTPSGRALPDFRVSTGEGRVVQSAALTTERQWLLLYVSPDSPPSEELVTALKAWQSPELIARTVIVVRGTAVDAKEWVRKTVAQELSAVRWYADMDLEAWKALELHGTPVLVGVHNGAIAWRLVGVLIKPGALESVVRTWVGGEVVK
jgi:hypothetical protein